MNPYRKCPEYKGELINIKQTKQEDAHELLRCYSDRKSVELFNSDNCNGDDFYYDNMQKMIAGIKFWEYSYRNGYFVRWTIRINESNRVIGTVEMFRRESEDRLDGYGVLRYDLESIYEKEDILNDVIRIANRYFFKSFDVKGIITKAIPKAKTRIKSLLDHGYEKMKNKEFKYDNYYIIKYNGGDRII